MRSVIFLCCVIAALIIPVRAMDFSAPDVFSEAEEFMPDEPESFGEGLLYIVRAALKTVRPSIMEAAGVCATLIATALLIGLLREFSNGTKQTMELTGTIAAGIILFQPANSLILLGTDTVQLLSQYGNLLLPVMTGALAAQGAVTKSGALYVATAFFDTLLSSAVSKLLVPFVYIFLCLAIGNHIFEHAIIKDMKILMKSLLTWGLKTILYVFTGYISISGVVGGTTDATLLKATKLTISGAVPVVGSIMADASEAVLVSAGMMKNAVGIYGLLAVIALWIGPFIQIGIQYLMLKITGGICDMFGSKSVGALVKDFSSAMGLILAMTGAVCLMFLISTICFMKGVS